MSLISAALDFFLHLDVKLADLVTAYGALVYGAMFLVVFCETGLVVTPLLPGDSLLFAAGALAAGRGALNVWAVLAVFMVAATLGDNVNYLIGRTLGSKLLASDRFSRLINRSYVERTNAFFAKHGGKTITLARFFPIIRTFAPFMAGMGEMHWPRFFAFSVGGTVAWVSLFVGAGYFFGNIPFVRDNFEFVVFGIIGVTLLPAIWHAVSDRLRKKPAAGPVEPAE